MVNSGEIIGTTEYMTLYTRFHVNRCFNLVRLYYVESRRKGIFHLQ
jgi:hypothetical protein